MSLRVEGVLLCTPHSFVTVSSLSISFYFCFLCPPYCCFHTFFLLYIVSFLYSLYWEPAQRSRYTDEAAGWTTEEFWGGCRKVQEIFSPPQRPYLLRGLPSLPFNWFRGSFPEGKTLVTKLRMSGPLTLFTLYAFILGQGYVRLFTFVTFSNMLGFNTT